MWKRECFKYKVHAIASQDINFKRFLIGSDGK